MGLSESHSGSSATIDYTRLNRLASGRYQRAGKGLGPRRGRHLLIGAGVVVAVMGAAAAWWYMSSSISVDGLADGDHLTPAALADTTVSIDVAGASPTGLTLDGMPTTATERDGALVWEPPKLEDGVHELGVRARRRFAGTLSTTIEFTVDSRPPAIELDPLERGPIGAATALTGRTDPEAQVELDTADGPFTSTADETGAFTLDVDHPPVGQLTSTDLAGNRASQRIAAPVAHPGTVAVHVTSAGWADPQRKATIISMIEQGRIDTVQLDLKDEDGVVGYDSGLPMATEIGAARADYVLDEALAELHELDVRVVGRIVAFRDPMLANAAWERGDTDWVLQTPDGDRFGAYDGAFVNFAHPRVREYNLDLAVEAAQAGVDEIMWDYVRRPEGAPESMVLQGQGDTPPHRHIVSFLAQAHHRLRPLGTHHNAAVFGISIDRGEDVAQDIPAMARHVDVLSPMVYPSHWNPGEYGVADPERQPYDIVFATVGLFTEEVAGTGTGITPWIQDFDSAVAYGRREVRAQVDAARDAGAIGVFLWDPDVEYTLDGLPPLD